MPNVVVPLPPSRDLEIPVPFRGAEVASSVEIPNSHVDTMCWMAFLIKGENYTIIIMSGGNSFPIPFWLPLGNCK